MVELAEYQELEVELRPAAERMLRAVAGHRLSTAPGGPGCFRIRASSHVGAITTPDVQVIIRPKVSIPTLLYLLEADGEPLVLAENDVALASSSDLVAAFCSPPCTSDSYVGSSVAG